MHKTEITDREQWLALRAKCVGCSEIAALFGVHEYNTAYTLAARKLGKLDETIDNDILQRGRLLEPVAMQLLAEAKPEWKQVPATAHHLDPEIRFGCTPDLFVDTDRGRGVVQIKTVAAPVFASKWRQDGTTQPPLWIALQAMCEQHLTKADFACVAALVVGYGLELHIIDVPYLPNVIEQARAKVRAFWELVDRGELPAPDYGADREAIAAIFRHDDGTEIDLTGDNALPELVESLEALRMAKRTAEDGIDEAQAKIMGRIGLAQTVRFAGGVITAKTVHRKEYVAKASSYRQLRVKRA